MESKNVRDKDILDYHEFPRPGKVEVVATKPCLTQIDLSKAYTPGVALPCLLIEKDPSAAYKYTNKGNLVAVITNGSAVLGLGNIGPLASKPVMEGKGVLFKRFAGIDIFDIELDCDDPDELIKTVQHLGPTFGGINLEDIKAPECFHIEKTLEATMDIPIFHDDQHGTAIIAGAGFMNAVEIAGKSLESITMVFSGAGAAGISCAEFLVSLGVTRENITLVDSRGVVYKGREKGMNPFKERFARDTDARTLSDAMRGADAFLGVSARDLVTAEMLVTMAENPIVFAMANPDPEVDYPTAIASRSDIIVATGRSDYPNQVNNVLGFPSIFRGALDCRARNINLSMKIAAAKALAALAREPVPRSVEQAYGGGKLSFGRDYIIPKPFDQRVLLWVAPAVAKAAMETGVARQELEIDEYRSSLVKYLGEGRAAMRALIQKARQAPKRIVFPEGEDESVLQAVQMIIDAQVAQPILLGNEEVIGAKAKELNVDLSGVTVLDSAQMAERRSEYSKALFELRKRRGMTPYEAERLLHDPHAFALMMVQSGSADGVVCGVNRSYPDTIRPALQIVGTKEGTRRVAGLYIAVKGERLYFMADATVNIEPDAEGLAEIAIMAADAARQFFGMEPRIAMLSYSNFGSVRDKRTMRVAKAAKLVGELRPDLVVDGEMQADTALVPELAREAFPHSRIVGDANVLIFPDLQSGNIAYKISQHLAGATVIGPILVGTKYPVNVLNHYSSTTEILHLAAITTIQGQGSEDVGS